MGVLARSLAYAAVFVAVILVFLPARILEWSGVSPPDHLGPAQLLGGVAVVAGVALAGWCVVVFALEGRGTPAPFDPPRRLVTRGPYRFVRNPMYLGGSVALTGAALFYRSPALLAFAVLFFGGAHVFVVTYEEPRLERSFGDAYREYVERTDRWIPRPPGPPATGGP